MKGKRDHNGIIEENSVRTQKSRKRERETFLSIPDSHYRTYLDSKGFKLCKS